MATSHTLEKPSQLANSGSSLQFNDAVHRSLPDEAANDNCKSQWKVQFEDGDPSNPKHFNPIWKAFLTFQMSLLALTGSMGWGPQLWLLLSQKLRQKCT
jgi:hypothetical protein